MTEPPCLAVGLMSGTSLDGMDAALVRFRDATHVELIEFVTRPYTAAERGSLSTALNGATARDLARLHVQLGEWAAEAVQQVLNAAHTPASALSFIAMHGHTVWHEPPAVSWQLGESAVVAERFGVRVVHNFRARDVAAGGQGAPLVPMADILLFGAATPRVLVNIGGMANATYVPRRADDTGAFAFDIGPGMAIIDAVARRLRPELPYDVDGAVSNAGTAHQQILDELLAAEWFCREPPKSTGRELFGDQFAHDLLERVPGADGAATAVELTAQSIARAVQRWMPEGELILSGGGARHPGLVQALERELAGSARTVRLFDDVFFNGDAKEAVAFALLGYLTIHGQPGNLPAATGAAGARVLGSIAAG